MSRTLIEAKILSPGPKKILACDGGGIRGLMSVEILAKLEADLRSHQGKPDLVLGDYFDFVCGTSTGAIIAACLATGMDMATLRTFYVDSGEQMFDKASIFKRLQYKYDEEPLAMMLQEQLNRALGYEQNTTPATLGDNNLRTMLMMVMRNHTTDSPWPVSNNPFAKYNKRLRDDCNLNLPLWQLVRASTAAPTFFPPEVVTFAPGTSKQYQFIFVDGGVTTYNNPAFMAFQMATTTPYGVNWSTGVENLLIVSVGTGNAPSTRPNLKPEDLWIIDHAKTIPSALMNAATAGWDMACRILGECRQGGQIDREFGSMVLEPGAAATKETTNWTGEKQFAYVRYDPLVTQKSLDSLGLADIKAENMLLMDSVRFKHDIQRVGQSYAKKYVDLSQLKGFT